MEQLSFDIYNSNLSIDLFLQNIQRNYDFGYFDNEFKNKDTNLQIYNNMFANGLPLSNLVCYDFILELRTIFNNILLKYNYEKIDIVHVQKNKNITIVLEHCVIRILTNTQYLNRKRLYDFLLNNDLTHFEKIYDVIKMENYDVYFIVSEKLIPIRNNNMEIKDMFKNNEINILNKINKYKIILHENDFIHGDLSLDNTGYRESDKEYVIYDFDNSLDISNLSFNEKLEYIFNDQVHNIYF